ncbi:Ig-like domain-containing protein [Martelella alba]|uniref:Ig-like protein group 3 n=1 Tax=Martelella alba TaxID=2590451 RepID=A0ABY2SHN6_9HYPH|nr:Ig-like domain-containing protein [Martelella alba]TKI04851.1 hypothetical protein FCN80_16140 [Martelella alba]
MSQHTEFIDHHDDVQVSLAADPLDQPQSALGTVTRLTATVEDRHHRPARDVEVKFSTHAAHARFSEHVVRTDHQGKAVTLLTYPYPPQTAPRGGMVTVYARTRCAEDTVKLVFYSEGLTPPRVINLKPGDIIDKESIAAGVQVVVYPWENIKQGNVATLYWGDNFAQRAFDGHNFPWVADIAKIFPGDKVLHDGIYRVFYEAIDNVGNIAESKPITVKVIDNPVINPTLLKPLLPAALHNVINLAAAKTGVEITLPGAQPEIGPCAQYRLFLDTRTYQGGLIKHTLIQSGEIRNNKNVVVTVGYPDLQGYDGVNGAFYYDIVNEDGAPALRSYAAQVIIDTVAPHLM